MLPSAGNIDYPIVSPPTNAHLLCVFLFTLRSSI